jgi:brefeldin A-resistance guanine nucleotide exchange factor 1
MANAGLVQEESIAMEHIVHSEILAVTSAMRRNYRWASFVGKRPAGDDALANTMGLRRTGNFKAPGEHKRERQEAELWASFEALKRKVRDCEGMDLFCLCYHHPDLLRQMFSSCRY